MRALWLWAGFLAFMLLIILPVSGWVAVGTGVAAALLVSVGWHWSQRRIKDQRQALVLMGDASLPSASYRRPIALVCGSGARALFGAECADGIAVRLTDAACYLSVSRAQRLPTIVDSLLALRPHWANQLCVVAVVNPSEQAESSALTADLQALRHQLACARRRGIALPLLVANYLPTGADNSAWFGWYPGTGNLRVLEQESQWHLGAWQQQAPSLLAGAGRLRSVVQCNAAIAWLAEQMIAPLTDGGAYDPPCTATACGVFLSPQHAPGVANNLWQRWLGDFTGLYEQAVPHRVAATSLPLPDPLLGMLALRPQSAPVHRAGAIALWLFVAACGIAWASSAWQNTLLVRQVSDDLRRYQTAAHDHPASAMTQEALAVLRRHASVLDDYYRYGEPLALGLGLYRGEPLRARVSQAVAAVRPAMADELADQTIHLDSLSLFAVGSATLKPDATPVLIGAMSRIQARPGWLILVTGHTDAAGLAQKNQHLSLARANAVRDWMQHMGSIPAHCIAVRGLGASQPIASNETEHGRAANRRVDIRLVPEPGSCMPALSAPDLQPPRSAALSL
ncbi:membrane protein [Pseudomonas turukhanskensis]|uniref:Membrane protein n=2 Tax=Pseudomonas turukhanskensis TaxID=1806536 RepID=A0A9W6K881_9PSED|nr:membrane protein [Pseudomonas turukhanskensis]